MVLKIDSMMSFSSAMCANVVMGLSDFDVGLISVVVLAIMSIQYVVLS